MEFLFSDRIGGPGDNGPSGMKPGSGSIALPVPNEVLGLTRLSERGGIILLLSIADDLGPLDDCDP